jgi:hypothetical protein
MGQQSLTRCAKTSSLFIPLLSCDGADCNSSFTWKQFYLVVLDHSVKRGTRTRRKKMQDYLRRLLIAGIMAVCVGLLFLGVKNVQAENPSIHELTSEWMWPAEGVLTDSFGTRNGDHKGIDIAAPLGSPVYAVDKGIVTKSYYSDTYGNVVFVKHDYGMETVYAHLQERMVQEGVKVDQGGIIGKMGNTGDSSGVHLHFEVHTKEWTFDKKNAVNPMTALGYVEVGQAIAVSANKQQKAMETSAWTHSDELQTYVVRQGDTLFSIARENGLSVKELTGANNITSSLIKPGQKLLLKK